MSDDAEPTQPSAPEPAPEPKVAPETPDPEIWVVTESIRNNDPTPGYTFGTDRPVERRSED